MKIKNITSPTDLSGLYIVYKGSTTIETPETHGLSHFLEHLVCKEVEYLFPEFNKYGVQFNAFTDMNYIVYYITGLDKYISKYSPEFIQGITKQMKLSKRELEKERKIVIEEYNRCFCSSDEGFSLNTFRKNLNYFTPIGDIDVIKNASKKTIMGLYNKQYVAPYLIANISKNHDLKIIDTDIKYKPIPIEYKYEIKPNEDFKSEDYQINDSSVNIINHSKEFIPESELHYSTFINKMLASDLTSPLYRIIREKHTLVYNLRMNTGLIGDKYILEFETQTARKNLKLLNSLFKEVISKPKKYITKELFDDTKLKLSIQKKINEIEQYDNVRALFSASIFYKDKLESITYEDVLVHYNKYYLDVENNFIFNNN